MFIPSYSHPNYHAHWILSHHKNEYYVLRWWIFMNLSCGVYPWLKCHGSIEARHYVAAILRGASLSMAKMPWLH